MVDSHDQAADTHDGGARERGPRVGEDAAPAAVEDPEPAQGTEPELKTAPEFDPDSGKVIEAEREKIEAVEKAIETFLGALREFNPEDAKYYRQALGKIREENERLRGQALEPGQAPEKIATMLKNLSQFIPQIVQAAGTELQEKGETELDVAFKELIQSAGLRYSWPQVNEEYNPDQHESDGVTKLDDPERNPKLAEVMSPCVIADGGKVLVKARVTRK
jgi:hypothetical protein